MAHSKPKVLFLCIGNSARSQMAEVLLRHHASDSFEVYSGGTCPEEIAPQTLAVLSKYGVKQKDLRSKHLSEFQNIHFDYVITLCDKARMECESYPTSGKSLEWNFEDPKDREGTSPFETTLSEIDSRIRMFILLETKQSAPELEINPVQFYKNLTDDIRLKCLMLIQYEGELCVCELMEALQDIQPKISRHLALLRKGGLLIDRRQGQWVYYRINPELPLWAKSVLSETTENNIAFIEDNIRHLSKMGARPERSRSCC